MNSLTAIICSFLLSIALISCSSDDADNNNPFDHTHSGKIDRVKHLFEHEFAQQCVASESVKLVDKADAQKRFAKPCMCIASYLFKDLTAKDSYTLLNDKKHSQLLRKKYEEAATSCL